MVLLKRDEKYEGFREGEEGRRKVLCHFFWHLVY